MGTTFAGVVRSPITSVVMIFELTRDYNIIVPLMISNLVAYAVARAIYHTPIYDALASQDGVHLPHAAGARPSLLVSDAMHSPALLLEPDTTAAAARERVPDGDCLVGQDRKLLGIVLASTLDDAVRDGQSAAALRGLIHHDARNRLPHVHPDHPADIVLHRLGQFGLTMLPVVDRREVTRVLGAVSLNDLLEAYRNRST
jgi:CIC family chloride channel protein